MNPQGKGYFSTRATFIYGDRKLFLGGGRFLGDLDFQASINFFRGGAADFSVGNQIFNFRRFRFSMGTDFQWRFSRRYRFFKEADFITGSKF